MSFWTDAKVVDDFTPEDRYFYLYLFTNPHTNLSGCYEISIRQMVNEVGYSRESIENLIKRFRDVHKVIDYSAETKEILLINWHKYNWTKSEKYRKPLAREIDAVKNDRFREYLDEVFNSEDAVSIRYEYGSDTSNANSNTNSNADSNTKTSKKNKKETKHRHGEYQNVLLTDTEFVRLANDFGLNKRDRAITFLDEYIEEKGYKSKSHNLAIRRWVMDAIEKEKQKRSTYTMANGSETSNPFLYDLEQMGREA